MVIENFCKEEICFKKTNVNLCSFYIGYNFLHEDDLSGWNM
jgi:hypothetical protein